MICKHADYGADTVAAYASGDEASLREVLIAFSSAHWREMYAGNHTSQAYRQKFFKLARERGIHELP